MNLITIIILGIATFLLLTVIFRKKIKKADFELFKFFKIGIETHSIKKLSENKKNKLDKSSIRILFIDDNKFPIIETLKNAGYVVQWMKDIKDLDDVKVVDSHVIFVDYKGVGKNLSQNKEGVGVCKMIKEKYGKYKYIVLCTGESIPNELLKEIKNISDEIVPKVSETTDFIKIIDEAIEKIAI